jgi:uncharacterized protein (TIRG00374 family)
MDRLGGQPARKTSALGKIVFPVFLAAAAYLVLLIYGHVNDLGAALTSFRIVFVVPVLALAVVNYGLRFARWHYYLRRCALDVPLRESAAVFFSGFAMSITPARLGELLKCVLLRDEAGVKMSVSVPVVVADRVSDLVAVCLLVAAGTVHYSVARGASLLAIGATVLCVAALGYSPWVAGAATRVFRRRFARGSEASASAAREVASVFSILLRGRPLLVGIALGVLAWFSECVALYVVLGGLGSTGLTLYAVTFVYALSTLGGALSLLPGGLGATEFGMTALLVLFGVARNTAVAAVLIVRLCTLWFATGLGLGVYLLHRRRVARLRAAQDPPAGLREVHPLEE